MSRTGAGILLLALAATSYGLVPILARFYYDGGGTPLALLAFRYLAATLLLAAVLPLLRTPFQASKAGVLCGVLLAIISYGYLASVRFIPVTVAALVFFTYPMLTVLIARLFGLERIGWRRAAGVLTAFLGLALGLNVDPSIELDWRGVALSGLAALGYTALLLVSQRAALTGGGIGLTFELNLVCAVVFIPIVWAAGEAAAPATASAWIGLLGVTLTFLLGITAFVAGIGRSGAVRAAALSNLEPLVSIGGAVLVLGESLTAVQSLGIALVAAGIYAMSR